MSCIATARIAIARRVVRASGILADEFPECHDAFHGEHYMV
jgi:hypothetical protein